LVHFTFQPLLKNPLFLGLAELFTLLLVAALLRNVWLRLKPLLMRYFRSPAEQRAFAMAQLQSELARITHSEDLVSTLEERLVQLLELRACTTYTGEDSTGLLADFTTDELNILAQQLVNDDDFWADAKVLNEREVEGDLENRLHSAGIALLLPIRRGRSQPGLLAVGHKRDAQLTLDEVQQLSRLCLQVGLTLEVLGLLETEQDLMRQTMEANLTALRAQINPHFLFNTLNSISELVHSNPKQAEEAIEHLAFIFRYTNKFSSEQFVTLENELSLVRSYLAIEKIRFGEGFEFQEVVDNALMGRMIPAFALQTVMENAVKHGVSKVVPPKRIRLSLAAEGAGCVLEVEDNGPGIDLSRIRASTGLNNVLHRMETLYGRADLLEFHNTGKGTLVRIHLPG
jgi:K+-sensing histidine kinase KdpD